MAEGVEAGNNKKRNALNAHVVNEAEGQLALGHARQRGLVGLHQPILKAALAAAAALQRQRNAVRDNDRAAALSHVDGCILARIVRVVREHNDVAPLQAQGAQHGIDAHCGILHKGARARGRAQELPRQGVRGALHERLPLLCAPHEAVRVGLHLQHGRLRRAHNGVGRAAIARVVQVGVAKVQVEELLHPCAAIAMRSRQRAHALRSGRGRARTVQALAGAQVEEVRRCCSAAGEEPGGHFAAVLLASRCLHKPVKSANLEDTYTERSLALRRLTRAPS